MAGDDGDEIPGYPSRTADEAFMDIMAAQEGNDHQVIGTVSGEEAVKLLEMLTRDEEGKLPDEIIAFFRGPSDG